MERRCRYRRYRRAVAEAETVAPPFEKNGGALLSADQAAE